MSTPQTAPVPVLVVGNCVVGGAGKTPTVMAVLNVLKAHGHRPAVLSRGYGRRAQHAHQVTASDSPAVAGDEPLLIHRRTGVPVWVGADRVDLAHLACQTDPHLDVLVCDDGLQHHRLARQVNLVVFDERGIGNGLLLPAGPLRQDWRPPYGPPQASPGGAGTPVATRVLYNAPQPSTALAGFVAIGSVTQAWPLSAWQCQDESKKCALAALRGQPLWAAAGLAAPEKFFAALQAAGLNIHRLPLPDHFAYEQLPWPPDTPDVLVTEKDAVKLQGAALGTTRVWVVPLDFELPAALGQELLELLFPAHAGQGRSLTTPT